MSALLRILNRTASHLHSKPSLRQIAFPKHINQRLSTCLIGTDLRCTALSQPSSGPLACRSQVAAQPMVLAFTCGLYPAPPCLQYITETSSRNNDVNKNDVFAISYAGIGKTGKHEYHIMNNNSGTFMTYPEGAPDGKLLTGEVMSPSNDRTRWSVRYFRTRIFYFTLLTTDFRRSSHSGMVAANTGGSRDGDSVLPTS